MTPVQWVVALLIALQCGQEVQAGGGVAFDCTPSEMVITVPQHDYFHDRDQPDEVIIEYSWDNSLCSETHNLTEDELVFTLSLPNGCGTQVGDSDNGRQWTFTNTLSARVASTPANSTTTDEDRDWNVECTYNRSETLAFSLDPNDLDSEDLEDYGSFAFSRALYNSDNSSLNLGSAVSVNLGETLRVVMRVTQNSDLELSLERCWATPTADSSDSVYYDLIRERCYVHDAFNRGSVDYTCSSDDPVQAFDIDVFRFVPNYDYVFLHCALYVCSLAAPSSACDCPMCNDQVMEPVGPRRRRRSPDKEADNGYDKGSRMYEVSIGPIVKVGEDDGKQDYSGEADQKKFPVTALIIGLVSGFVAIAVIIIVVIVVMRKRRQRATLTVERNNEVSVKVYNQVPGAEQL